MDDVELSVILTTFNRASLVEDMLRAISEQTWSGSWQVVLVDNNSTDHTLDLLQNWAEKMPVPTHVVVASQRQNPSYARSVGVNESQGHSMVFVDDDDLIGPGFVEAIGEALRTEELVGARHQHHRLNPEAVARYRGSHQSEQLGEVFGVPVAGGGGMGCTRALWDRLSGQTETFGYGSEDTEFCLRASTLGVTTAFVPDALYHVRHRSGFAASFHQARTQSVTGVHLYKQLGSEFGERPAELRSVLRAWFGLGRRLNALRDPGAAENWAWRFGRLFGRMQGSVLARTWYP